MKGVIVHPFGYIPVYYHIGGNTDNEIQVNPSGGMQYIEASKLQ